MTRLQSRCEVFQHSAPRPRSFWHKDLLGRGELQVLKCEQVLTKPARQMCALALVLNAHALCAQCQFGAKATKPSDDQHRPSDGGKSAQPGSALERLERGGAGLESGVAVRGPYKRTLCARGDPIRSRGHSAQQGGTIMDTYDVELEPAAPDGLAATVSAL